MASKLVQVLLIASLFVAVACTTADTVTYTGTFVKLMEDYFKEGFARHKFGLKDIDNGLDFLELDPDEVKAVSSDGTLPINRLVTIRGVRTFSLGGVLSRLRLLSLDVSRSKRVNGNAPGYTGDKKVLVILTQLANSTYGTTTTTCSASTITGNMWTASTNVNGMWQFASRGALSASQSGGTVIGPYTVQARTQSGSQTVFDCDPYGWANAAKSQASAAGYNPNSYDIIHYSLPSYNSMNCGWGGLGEISGPNSWTAQCTSKSTTAHEMGHNLGFQHSSSLVNNVFAEYGDGTCTMGDDGSSGDLGTSYHILQRRKAGWLSYPNAFVQVSNNGSPQNLQLLEYNTNPNSLTASSPYAIQLNVPDGAFYFSYKRRQSSGYDTGLAGSGTVTVHFYSGNQNDHPIRYGAHLGSGSSYYNSTGQWRVTVNSVTTSAASVTVQYDSSAPCQTSVAAQGFENGLGSWTLSSSSSNIQPVLTTTKSAPTSPSTSVNMVQTPTTAATQTLTSPLITIPSGSSSLSFAMKYLTDPGVVSNNVYYCTEAAIVSVIDGSTKTQLNGSVPYRYRVFSGLSNPLAGKIGWCSFFSNDVETNWQTVNVDTAAFAGKSVRFVWDFGTDSRATNSYTPTGFYFDDIQINNKATCNTAAASTTTTGVQQSVAGTTRAAVQTVQTTAVRTTAIQTTDVKTTGTQTTGIQTTGRQSSGFLFGKRNIVAEKSREEIEQQVLAKRAADVAIAQKESLALPLAAAGSLMVAVVAIAFVVIKVSARFRHQPAHGDVVPLSA